MLCFLFVLCRVGAVGVGVCKNMSVSPCRCCMFEYCVHPIAVFNAASFYMTCSWLLLVEVAGGDNMEEAYSRAGLMTAL